MLAPAPTLRSLLALAMPMVLARSTQAVVGFGDAIMVAPLGQDALAAVTTGALNVFALIILPMGTVFIVQSFAAQLVGKNDLTAARRYAWYGLAFAALTMVAGAVATPLIGPVLGLLGHDPRVHDYMTEYMVIRMSSVGAVVATEALANWYGGLGNTWLQLIVGVVTMIIDLLGNYALIEGHWGFPALGVAGAAWTSTISSWLGFAIIAVAFQRGWGVPAGAARIAGRLGLRASELVRMIRFGLPNGINWFLEFSAFLVFVNIVVADLGTATLAAFNVVIQINSISFMPAFGITSAGAILAGQAIGRGDHAGVVPVFKLTLAVAIVWMVGIGLLYLIAPEALMGLFAPRDQPAGELIAVGATILVISAGWQLFDATAMTLSETLRAAGDTAWPALARVTIAWFIFTPGAVVWVMVLGGGPVAATVCMVVYLGLLSGALAWRFRSGAWRSIDLTGVEPKLV
jgi:MATE family multidrug resistance protein